MGYSIGQQGWIKDPVGCQTYAATLATADDFWDKLRAADDGGNRFYYRALAMCVRDLNLAFWLSKRGGILVLRTYDQSSIGSCVGTGESKRQGYIAALDVWLRLDPEKFVGMFSPEWAYYASRAESGMLNRGDGSTGYGAARAAVSRGSLVQGKYGLVDLSKYTVSRCREFGYGRGIPPEAIAEAKKHTYAQYVKVDTAEKAWLCAGAGFPFNLCSGVGWEGERDEDGAIKQRGSWNHSMCCASGRKTTKSGRKLLLVDQSWITDGKDDWTTGPYSPDDQPWGTFWSELDPIDEACSEGDSFVDIGYVGDTLPVNPVSFTEM